MTSRVPIIHPLHSPFGRPKGSKSIEEALASVGSDPRRNQSNADGQVLEGYVVTDYWYARREAGVVFSNQMAVCAWVGEDDLYWLVAPVQEFVRPDLDDLGELCWVKWQEHKPLDAWYRADPFRKRIGGRFWMLDAADFEVRIYLHGFDILIFTALGDKERGGLFMYWYEDD